MEGDEENDEFEEESEEEKEKSLDNVKDVDGNEENELNLETNIVSIKQKLKTYCYIGCKEGLSYQ
jgi:hypothetical protein